MSLVLLTSPAFAGDCDALLPAGVYPTYTQEPAHHTELCHAPAFWLSHDNDAHEPRVVAWVVTAEHLKTNVGRTNDFHADAALPEGAGSKPSDYAGSHYDQGHMSDAEDNGWSPETEHMSFLMSNMIPQTPAANREEWRYIENWTRTLAKRVGQVHVLSGPILDMGSRATIGHDGVLVPTASWKAIIAGNRAWGFVVPNAQSFTTGSNIAPYQVSLRSIETMAHLKLPLPANVDMDGKEALP